MSQRQWTIEARADCSDGEKEAIKQTVRQLGRHLCAQLNLLPTKVRVQVVCFSNDFFSGHDDDLSICTQERANEDARAVFKKYK